MSERDLSLSPLFENKRQVNLDKFYLVSVAKNWPKEILLGATSINKIGEVWLFSEIGEGGVEILKKPNFTITIRYEIPTFSSVEPFFEEGGRGSRKVRPETELFGIFSIEVAPKGRVQKFFFKKVENSTFCSTPPPLEVDDAYLK